MQKLKAILAIVAVGFVVALIIFNASRPIEADPIVWNTEMTKGNQEKGQHFIMYTDIFCPYCDKFSNALAANKEDYETNYINNDKIFFELRITQFNYLSGHSPNSQPGGESAYCAARQQKFWPYYEAILAKLFTDYHSKGIGVSKTSEKMPELDISYFYQAAETAELSMESFRTCMENHEAREELEKNTTRAQKQIQSGVPYFVSGTFNFSGFDGNWDTDNDYKQAKLLLDASLNQ